MTTGDCHRRFERCEKRKETRNAAAKRKRKKEKERDAYPERVPERDVLLAGDGLLVFARLRPRRERHRVHQPLPLAPLALQLLRHLHQVRDVVPEVANVLERVHRARRRLGPPPFGFRKRDAREQVLLDFRTRLHARELTLRERARRVADVAAELLGSLAELLREFLNGGVRV